VKFAKFAEMGNIAAELHREFFLESNSMTKQQTRTHFFLNYRGGKALLAAFVLLSSLPAAADETVSEIRVFGNRAVQAQAVQGLMGSRTGEPLDAARVRDDIRSIYKSGYFQDVRIERLQEGGKLILLVKVVEKPSIREIQFSGFEEVTPTNLKDKLQVKQYTIVDERKINTDLRLIEQNYVEKGYYLARASYTLKPTDSGEVILIYNIIENNPVSVSRVNLLGNAYFSDSELKTGMATREKRWSSWFNQSGTFRDEFVNRDKEYLAYIFRDNGFAEANVTAPQSRLDRARQNVEVSFYIEEGERFNIGKIKISGDLLFPESVIREKLAQKEGSYFRISQFQSDIRTLTDLYGDEGFAFVDVLPKTTADREKRTMDIEFVLTKGEKVYFRNIVVEGNSKTRDNVIRRNIKVTEGERFHSTKLEQSKSAVERLGFFQEVTIQREPDSKNKAMDLRVRVKEKSTGSLSASLGASPSTKNFNFFASGQYNESNFLGRGWATGLEFKYDQSQSYSLNLSLTEPSLNDGPWSVTGYGRYSYNVGETEDTKDKYYLTRRRLGTSVGREIIEDLRMSLGYSFEWVDSSYIAPARRLFLESGNTERISQSLTFDKTNNYLQPTSGVSLSLSNTFAINLLGGEHYFGKAEANATLYVPLVFGEDFLTNFRFSLQPGYLYPIMGKQVPVWERFYLGSQLSMKAYMERREIFGPKVQFSESPGGIVTEFPIGGDKRLYGVAEYFIPVIPEANLRMVTFWESGQILGEKDIFKTQDLKHDFGFGFRWQTPVAPFRFEWAWPVENGKIGESQFIFFIGPDSASEF
jgi:outer membrane protein insertion porin family